MFSYPAHYISVKRAGKSDAKKDAADTFNYCFHGVSPLFDFGPGGPVD